jgi:hypothetical protein
MGIEARLTIDSKIDIVDDGRLGNLNSVNVSTVGK